MDVKQTFYTGSKWFGQKVLLESSGDKEVDKALKSTFHDHYHRTAPLLVDRADCQLALKFSRGELTTKE